MNSESCDDDKKTGFEQKNEMKKTTKFMKNIWKKNLRTNCC